MIRVGVSGWTFDGWRKGTFYPEKLARKNELHYASRQLNSIEINGTFYAIQKPSSFENWYQQTPENFVFSIKAAKYITHVNRLKSPTTGLANFFATGLLGLEEKIGPILWQFAPFTTLKDDRFENFFEMLPKTTKEAVKFAKKHHSEKLSDITHFDVIKDRPLRHVFEFRHESFMTDEFYRLLEKHQHTLVFAHAGKKDLYSEVLTSDCVYLRLHGVGEKYETGYSAAEIKKFANKISKWDRQKKDVFLYFDNDSKETAPQNAIQLTEILGICPQDAETA